MKASVYASNGAKEQGFHWNWLDTLLCILLAVLLLGGVLLFRYWRGREEKETGTVTYTLLLSGVETEFFENGLGEMPFAVGSVVKSHNGTAEMGEVVEISREQHRTFTVSNGRAVWVDATGKYDYYVTVQSEARHSAGDGIRVGDIRVGAGMRFSLRLGEFYTKDAQVISVRWERGDDA